MGISTRLAWIWVVKGWPAERPGSRAMLAMRFALLGKATRMVIGAWRVCRDIGRDERHRGWPWTSEVDRYCAGE